MNRYTHIPRYIQYLYGYRSDIYVYVPGVHRCALIYTDMHMFLYQSPCTIWDYSLRNEGQKGSMLWAWHLWQGWRAGIGQPPLLHQLLGHDLAHRPCHSSCLTRLHLFCSVWFSKDNPFQLALHALSALLLCLAILECCLIYTYMNRYRHIYTDMHRYAQICTDKDPYPII